MKRYYDLYIIFEVDTVDSTFKLTFSNEWRPTDMLRYMCDTYCIEDSSIVETRTIYVKRYKLTNND